MSCMTKGTDYRCGGSGNEWLLTSPGPEVISAGVSRVSRVSSRVTGGCRASPGAAAAAGAGAGAETTGAGAGMR